jgi:hypothetical protein
MKVPEELLKKWNDLRSHGDGKAISEQNADITEMSVSRAFTTGECSDETFEAIANFYKEKEEKVNQYL